MKNLLNLLIIGLLSCVYSNDVIFMIDSSKSIFGSEQCDYTHLIQNFTSDFVNELSSYNTINYASVQYNVKGTIDFPFCNNNSEVYGKMKNYDFKFGAPTLIHTGLEKVTELYSDNYTMNNNSENIYLVLLTDGESLNKEDFQNALLYYPFNLSKFNTILIKIGTHVVDNNIVLDVFNNTGLNYLTCQHNPLEHIFNNTLFYPTTSTTTSSSTTSSTTTSSSTTSSSITTTITSTSSTSTTTSTSSTSTSSLTTSTSSSTNTSVSITNNYTTTSTNISNKNRSIDCGNNSIPNSTNTVISIYKILVYVTTGIIFLFSVIACLCICCYKTTKKIKPSIDTEIEHSNNDNVIHHSNIMPMFGRSIKNEIYEANYTNGEYIEVDDSLDNHNYLKYNSNRSTDF